MIYFFLRDYTMITSPFNKKIAFSAVSARDNYYQLHPEEQKIISPKAVENRKIQFYLGRMAVHNTLVSILGPNNIPVLKSKRGEPLWPSGIIGAITHTGDTAVAAAGRTEYVDGIGIDIEQLNKKVSFKISKKVCTPAELKWVSESADKSDARLKMIFSAKESIYKALYPLEKIELGFKDAELIWDPSWQIFHGKLLRAAGQGYPAGYDLSVGCKTINDLIFTFMTVPADYMIISPAYNE